MSSNITFGAIRWDAWYAPDGPARDTATSLSNPTYRWRAPFFAIQNHRERLQWNVSTQTMSQEIAAAKALGLSFWAFLAYGTQYAPSQMTEGWNLFQANPDKNNINWCWMQSTGTLANGKTWGNSGGYTSLVPVLVSHMQQPNYQTVLGRPLFFLYWDDGEITGWWGGNTANCKTAIDLLRSQAQSAGLGNPYVTLIGGGGVDAEADRASIGADAVSNYISRIPSGINKTYASLDLSARAHWQEHITYGTAGIIPNLMAGWNSRPRKERPVSWDSAQRPQMGLLASHDNATTNELVTHTQACVDFINANPARCAARAALWYAWNEHDEGGWLCPTLGDPTNATRLPLYNIMA